MHSRTGGGAPHGGSYATTSPQSVIKSFPSELHLAPGGDTASELFELSPDSPAKNPFEPEYVPPVTFAPNRRLETGITVQGTVTVPAASRAFAKHGDDDAESGVHPFVQNYTSPIDLVYRESQLWASPMSPTRRR